MDIGAFTGMWRLNHRAENLGELEMIEKKIDPTGASRWLAGNGRDFLGEATPCGGLALTINPDGKLQETRSGAAAFDWFDVEGVLEPQGRPVRRPSCGRGGRFQSGSARKRASDSL